MYFAANLVDLYDPQNIKTEIMLFTEAFISRDSIDT